MKKTTLLKQMLRAPELLVAPGAYDVLSAKIIEHSGFKAVYMTGYGTSASILGQPDVGLLTMTEMVDRARNLAEAVDVPVLADGDTGYGNPLNVMRTVREYEKAGVCAIQLEDQVFPKRCGHMLGRKVIPREEMVQKIKAAADSRRDDDFVIIARTDARTDHGLEEALERGKAYEEAGADLIFIESPENLDEMRKINEVFPNTPTLANMLEGGRTPIPTTKELEDMGFGIAIYCTGPLYAAALAVRNYMQHLKTHNTTADFFDHLLTFPEFNAFIDVLLMKMYRFKDNDGHREELEIPAEELEKAQELNKELVEMAAEHDEALMELYFDKGTLTQDDIRSGLKIGVSKREVMPIFCTSGKRDIGTKRLMEFIINVAPGPQKAPAFLSTEGEEITADETAPAVAFVFKSQVEQHIGEITYFRVIRGRIAEGAELVNTRTGNKEKLSQLFAVAGKNRIKVTELMAGDIGCTVKLKGTRTNDTLSAPSAPVTVEPIAFPEPRYRAAIKCKDQADEEKLGKVLNDAKFEDPTILVEYSKELKQTIIQGQGEHHLNILRSRIEKENKLAYEYIAPKIPYRETITKVAQADYRHKKQSGGAGQFGEVHMIIEPYYEGIGEPKNYKVPGKGDMVLNPKTKEEYDLPWGGKLQFYSAIVGGAIDARFMPAILKGIMEKMDEGPLTGSYARDIRVVIYDGKMHPVDSNEISFKLAARNAFKEAFRNAGPKIMEPIYNVEILVPSDYMGAVMSDLQNRRAMIEGMSSDKGFERLVARVPLSEMYRYSTTLNSLTNGRATYSMKFSSYEQVPAEVQDKLLKAYADTDKDE